jgi:K+-transporting ATPase ATPase B chain
VIIAPVPLALHGVSYRPAPAIVLLVRNLLIYGVGGILSPFVFIKLIDLLVAALHLAP